MTKSVDEILEELGMNITFNQKCITDKAIDLAQFYSKQKEFISQTKQELCQAILERLPKKKEHNTHCSDPEVCSDLCGASNYNSALSDCQDKIKEMMK